MEGNIKVEKPESFTEKEKKDFLELLIDQGQVSKPSLEKINNCHLLAIFYFDEVAIGIGAFKQVYSSPFEYAKCQELREEYSNYELGYLYIKDEAKKLSLGKFVSKLLIREIGNQKSFATTELKDSNPMTHILKSCGFKNIGNPYNGNNTGKLIGLFIRSND